MTTLTGLVDALPRHDLNTREELRIVEYDEIALPSDVIRSDGSLDLYHDVQNRFDIRYSGKERRHLIRAGGWIGYVPINDQYVLRIDTRVPVSNLEHIISRSSDTNIHTLNRFSKLYGHSSEKPQTLYDVMTDTFLTALDLIWDEGLAKSYRRKNFSSSTPAGSIDPFRTAVMQATTYKPHAVYSAFHRTNDIGPNRMLKLALECLNFAYRALEQRQDQSRRIQRIRSAINHLDDIETANESESTPDATARYMSRLTQHRRAYHDALRLSQYIINELGFNLRMEVGLAALPVILVDMASIFEGYVRSILRMELSKMDQLMVYNGNVFGSEGAKKELFSRFDLRGEGPYAAPDIVIKDHQHEAVAIIDVKYKPSKQIPERSEINQIICYSSVYRCNKAMILYPNRLPDGEIISSVGLIGDTQVYCASLDLGVENLRGEEIALSDALKKEIQA